MMVPGVVFLVLDNKLRRVVGMSGSASLKSDAFVDDETPGTVERFASGANPFLRRLQTRRSC